MGLSILYRQQCVKEPVRRVHRMYCGLHDLLPVPVQGPPDAGSGVYVEHEALTLCQTNMEPGRGILYRLQSPLKGPFFRFHVCLAERTWRP